MEYSASATARHAQSLRPGAKRSASISAPPETFRAGERHLLVITREERAMPAVDLLLPPRNYSPWHPNRRREPWPFITFAAVGRIALWIERTRQRRMLSELDDHML